MPPRSLLERGVTMIEVMIALLVLSVGLLGVAITMAKSSRFAAGAWAQSAIASNLSDMAERLRSSPNAANANFTLTDTYDKQRTDVEAGTVELVKDCDATACTAAETGAFHVTQWRLGLNQTLPGAAGWLRPLSSASNEARATSFEMAVMWFDKSNTDSSGAPAAALVCTGTETGVAERRCCPAAANAAAGVRCTRTVLVP